MQVTRLLALAALSLLAMSHSCKKEESVRPCPAAVEVAVVQVPGFAPAITEPIPNVGQSYQYLVNSAADYQALFGVAPPQPIDFVAYTLLAGKTKTAGHGYLLSQHLVQVCSGYRYRVQLATAADDDDDAVSSVVYYTLVPKLASTAKVEFDVQLPAPLN